MYVVVQFYRWSKISFLLFETDYHTLPYPKTKTKKEMNYTKDKIEPRHLRTHTQLVWHCHKLCDKLKFNFKNLILHFSPSMSLIIFSKLESFHRYQFTEKIRWSTPSIGTMTIRLRRFSFYITWLVKWQPSPQAWGVALPFWQVCTHNHIRTK